MSPKMILLRDKMQCGVGLLVLSTFLISAASTQAAESRLVPWYVVSVEGEAMGRSTENVYLFSRVQVREDGQTQFWIVERSLKEARLSTGVSVKRDWIDGRKCPALAQILAELPKPMSVRMEGPDRNVDVRPPADVPRFRVSGPEAGSETSGGARISRTEFLGAKSRWWARVQPLLETCWSEARIKLNGVDVASSLTQPSDIQYWKRW